MNDVTLTTVPGTAPGVTDVYGQGWSHLKRCFLELFLLAVVWGLFGAASGYLQRRPLIALVYHVLVLGPLSFGGMYAFLRAARGQTPEVMDLFAGFRVDYWQAVLANLLMSALIAIGMVLLIVPGVIVAIRLSWVPYLVVEEKRDALAAVRGSWELTRGHALTIFGIWMLAIPIALAGLLLLIVGVIPALMWAQLASTSYYVAVTSIRSAPPAVDTAQSLPGQPAQG